MKVEILIIGNIGDDNVTITKEVTEEQYNFLLSISEELDAKAVPHAPKLIVKPIEQNMERKVGEIFDFNGTTLLVVKKKVGCKGCYFNKESCKRAIEKVGYCVVRKDGKRVIFQEVKTK